MRHIIIEKAYTSDKWITSILSQVTIYDQRKSVGSIFFVKDGKIIFEYEARSKALNIREEIYEEYEKQFNSFMVLNDIMKKIAEKCNFKIKKGENSTSIVYSSPGWTRRESTLKKYGVLSYNHKKLNK